VAASTIYLLNGPCNGKFVSANEIVGGLVAYIRCGGGYYVLDDGATHKGADAVFKYAGKTQPGPPGPPASGIPPHTHKGWSDLQRSVNTNMPQSLSRTSRNARAALRNLAGARRVRF